METPNLELETLKQLLKQQEKLASLGLLSAGIAHEIQNPLNFVINFSKMSYKLLKDLYEVLEDNKDKIGEADREEIDDIVSDLRENMNKIVEHSERAINTIQGILLISRGKEGEFIPSDINVIVKEYIRLSYHAMRAKRKNFNISIHEDYQDNIPQIMIVPQDFSRAILNIMNNACYSVWVKSQIVKSESYTPTIDVSVKYDDKNIMVAIKDNGLGMSEEVKKHIYENFYTTKPVGEGTGLGMAITHDIIVNRLHGKIQIDSIEGEYACFTLIIPAKIK